LKSLYYDARSEKHQKSIQNVRTFSALVQPIGAKFKIYVPTKLVITQNDRNHSAFDVGKAVLGFELSLPCYTTDVNFEGFKRSGNRWKQDPDCTVDVE